MENKKIIFGRNPVLEYLKSTGTAERSTLYVSNTAHGKIIGKIISSAQSCRVKVEYCGRDFLSRFEPTAKHQGVVLEIQARQNIQISDEDFILNVRDGKGIIVLLDHLTDPHNVGSIIRTTEALGGDAVALPRSHSADITGAVIKTSAGATAHLRVITVPNAAGFLEEAKKTGFWIIGTSDKGDSNLEKLRDLKPAVIIIGSEGAGMKRLTLEKCDHVSTIPLKGKIQSLNASVAAGIILYEALKPRSLK